VARRQRLLLIAQDVASFFFAHARLITHAHRVRHLCLRHAPIRAFHRTRGVRGVQRESGVLAASGVKYSGKSGGRRYQA